MATNSSVFSGSTNAKYQVLHLVFNQVSQDIPNNRTNFSYEAYIQGTGGGSGSTTAGSYSITGATTKSDSKKSWSWNTTTKQTIATGSFYVNHNSDGTLATQTLSISASFKTTSATLTASTSVSLSVATIPRYASITGFSASINDRSASLSWTADKTISQWRWSTNSGTSYSAWETVNATSGSKSISVSPGSTYGFRIQVRSSASGLDTTSSTVSKTATKTPSTLTLNTTSQNVGSGITWTINKSYSDYTHTIAYYFGNTSGWILGSAASSTASSTWTVPTALANQIPSAKSGSGTIYVYTYYGSVHVGTNSYNFTAKVPDNATWQPTVPSVTISDAGTRPTGITSYVQGKAKAKVVSSSTAQGGASISSYTVTVSGIGTYYGSTITSGFLTKPGTVTITVRATDSRGYWREKSNTITVVEYNPPQLPTFNASRSQSTPTDILANFSASISPINSQNYKYFRIRSKASDGSWVVETDTTQNYTFSGTQYITSNPDKSYTIEFYVQDSYTSITQTVQVGTAFTLLDFNASGRGMAIGKVSEQNAFEVAMPFILDGVTLQSLPAYHSFTVPNATGTVEYFKIAEVVRDVGSGQSHGVALITGGGSFGSPASDIDVLHVGTRNSGVVRYLRLMKGDSSSSYGYVDNTSTGKREIWIEGSSWNGITSVNVLQEVDAEFKLFTRTTTKPSGWVYATQITSGSGSVSWNDILSKPSTFAPSSHTHAWSQVTGAPAQATRWPSWSEVTSKPTTFAPSAHNQAWSTITSQPATATRWPTWAEVTGKPSTFTSVTALYSGSMGANSSATMSSMSGYTLLIVVMYMGSSSSVNRDTMIIPVSDIPFSTTTAHFSRISWGSAMRYGNFGFGSATNIRTYGTKDFWIKTIYGVK